MEPNPAMSASELSPPPRDKKMMPNSTASMASGTTTVATSLATATARCWSTSTWAPDLRRSSNSCRVATSLRG